MIINLFKTVKNKIGNSEVSKNLLLKGSEKLLQLKVSSPEILLGLGIVGGVVSAVLLAKAYSKQTNLNILLDDDIEQSKQELVEETASSENNEVDTTTYYRLATKPYVNYGMSMVKNYGPSLTLGGLSIWMILYSHGIIKNRNQALLATVKLLSDGIRMYRDRVRDVVGKEEEERLFLGLEKRTVTDVSYDENGKKVKTTTTETYIPEDYHPSMYTWVFSEETSINWSPDRNLTRTFLEVNQSWANNALNGYGYLVLNDVLKHLGLPRCQEGLVVGWSLKSDGDKFVDYGLHLSVNESAMSDNVWILNFNVNGAIDKYVPNHVPFVYDERPGYISDGPDSIQRIRRNVS